MIEVIDPGPLSTIQDGGRPGLAALGVPRSGAFDSHALHLANRLVGNAADAAAIEITFGGLTVRLHDAATVALTGALVSGLDWGVAVTLPAGTQIRLGRPPVGARSYLALRGGIDAPAELGSRSTDLLSRLGPPPLRRGDGLPAGRAHVGDVSGTTAAPQPMQRQVGVITGPRDDWFTPESLAQLTDTSWVVRPESDRVGVRLEGPALERLCTDELPSEPTLPGALQVPPDGRPIVLGPDAPVTGGYPVIAVVRSDDFAAAAQWRPGDVVRFTTTSDG